MDYLYLVKILRIHDAFVKFRKKVEISDSKDLREDNRPFLVHVVNETNSASCLNSIYGEYWASKHA